MRLHRFFIGHAFRAESDVTVTDEALVHQWTSVLRLKENDRMTVLDGNNSQAEATVLSIAKKTVTLRIGMTEQITAVPARAVTLCCSVLRRENFEFVVQKATEVGVARIIPLLTDRTVKTGINLERLRKIAIEAMEQSGRGTFPMIDEPCTPDEALTKTEGTPSLFFHFGGKTDWEKSLTDDPVSIWIGPEGGWSEEEARWARTQKMITCSLGNMTLRAETAAIVASYLSSR